MRVDAGGAHHAGAEHPAAGAGAMRRGEPIEAQEATKDNEPRFDNEGGPHVGGAEHPNKGGKNEEEGPDREENTESKEEREGREGKGNHGGPKKETDIHKREEEEEKTKKEEKTKEEEEETESEPQTERPEPHRPSHSRSHSTQHYSSESPSIEEPPIPVVIPPQPPTPPPMRDTGTNCPEVVQLCNNDLYRSLMAEHCAGTCAGDDNSCLDRRPDLCPHWLEKGFCMSTFYSQEAKLNNCARTCGFCPTQAEEPIIQPVIVPVPVPIQPGMPVVGGSGSGAVSSREILRPPPIIPQEPLVLPAQGIPPGISIPVQGGVQPVRPLRLILPAREAEREHRRQRYLV